MPCGGYRVVYEYANRLANKGHVLTIVYPRYMNNIDLSKYNSKEKTLIRLGKFKNIFIEPKNDWHSIDENVKLLYISEPISSNIPDSDVTFATSWETAEYVNKYPISKGKKFYLIQSYEIWSGSKIRVDNTWKYPFKKIVIAKWLYNKGLELGVPKSMMEHIPNAIDTKKYRLIKKINSRPKKITMMYSSIELKGAPDGITALEIAKIHKPDLEAILFGTTERPDKLPEWIDYVRNPAQDVLVRDIYNGSSIYLCPSWIEGWHLPPAEAMACGCAVVSTNNTGVLDYAFDRKTGLLSPIKDPESLAKNLIKLLENDSLRIEIANNGHQYINDNFSWDKSTQKLENLILS